MATADDEPELDRLERQLLEYAGNDSRRFQYALDLGVRPEHFRRPGHCNRFRELIANPPADSPYGDAGKYLIRVQGPARKLIAAAPNRAPWIEPPREQPQPVYDMPAPAPKARTKKPPKQTKDFASRRGRKRETDLHVLVRHSQPVLGHALTMDSLRGLFPDSDIMDPDNPATGVLGSAIGSKLGLTAAKILALEEAASAYAASRGYAKTQFAFRTITVADDAEVEELQQARRRRRNKRGSEQKLKARTERERTKMLQTEAAARAAKTFAGILQEQRQRTQAQRDAIVEVLTDEPVTIRAIVEAVRSTPAWRQVPTAKMERTVIDRLDDLTSLGRVENSYGAAPRGSRLRLVCLTATARPRD